MPSPFGIWTLIANGHPGTLEIDPPAADGRLTGKVNGHAMTGFWDEATRRITFMISTWFTPSPPIPFQTFRGYLSTHKAESVSFGPPGGPTQYTLAGTFDVFGSIAGTYGWFAGGPYFTLKPRRPRRPSSKRRAKSRG